MIVNLARRPSGASFSSYVHTAISMANWAAMAGYDPYVDWRDHPAWLYADQRFPGNMWEWFFEQPCSKEPGTERWLYEDPSWRPDPSLCGVRVDDRWELPWNAHTPTAIARLQEIVPRFLRVKTPVVSLASELFERHGLDPSRTVAVSYRSTDKASEAWPVSVAPVESFFDAIDAARRSGDSLWINAEDQASQAGFLARYPDAVIVHDFFVTPETKVMADKTNPGSGHSKALAAVTMMVMFSRCNVLIKNASNLGDLAAGLSRGRVVCVT